MGTSLATPGLRRRMAAFLYEGVILFGVLMISGYLYSSLTQQRHALEGRHGLQAFLFVVLGIYFVWLWSHGGQTVAMKTWHIRVLTQDGRPLTEAQALGRYLLSWLWFMPALGLVYLAGWHSSAPLYGCLLGGVLLYAILSKFLPQQQLLHDVICRTRVVSTEAPR
jgi:uncharacterized RDD family membrane protein YckC